MNNQLELYLKAIAFINGKETVTSADIQKEFQLKYVPAAEVLQWLVTHNFLTYDKSKRVYHVLNEVEVLPPESQQMEVNAPPTYTQKEIDKFAQFFRENFHSIYLDDTELEVKTSLQIALADVYAHDVELYAALLDFACEEHQKRTEENADDTFFFFCAFLLYNYNARYHGEDFLMHYDDNIPLLQRMRSEMFRVGENREWLIEFLSKFGNKRF